MRDRNDLRDVIGAAIAEVAQGVVRPLFRNLQADDIQVKGVVQGVEDYVTAADLACEAALAQRLATLLPGVPLVGEEGIHRGTAALPGPTGRCFICDPIDGTRHFRAGNERYSIMLVLVEDGQPTHAWIHAPERGLMADAALGAGARINGERIRLDNRPLAAGDGIAAFGEFRGERLKARLERLVPGIVQVNGYGVGMDVMDVLLGRGRGVVQTCAKIWDILPGQFIMSEAGLFTGRLDADPCPVSAAQWTYALPSRTDVERLLGAP